MTALIRQSSLALLLLISLGTNGALAVPASGNVYFDGTPICALVLINGVSQFSCDGSGRYDMNVPVDGEGKVTTMVFADGFAPFKRITSAAQAEADPVAMAQDEGSSSLDVRADQKGEPGSNQAHTLTYNKNVQAAGHRFSVGGVDYRLVDLPIYEYSTGDRYVVRYPIQVLAQYVAEYDPITMEGYSYTRKTLSWGVSHVLDNRTTRTGVQYINIDGYEGWVNVNESRSYSLSISRNETPYSTPVIDETANFDQRSGCGLGLQIQESYFTVSSHRLYGATVIEDISPQDISAGSYVDNVPAPSERDPDLARTACDDLLDYIQVFGPSQARDTSPSTQQATNID